MALNYNAKRCDICKTWLEPLEKMSVVVYDFVPDKQVSGTRSLSRYRRNYCKSCFKKVEECLNGLRTR